MRRNLRKRRTILTILTIALATFIYTVLVSVPASMDRVVKDASGTLRLIINNNTAPWEDLPARYCDAMNKNTCVAACTAITEWLCATWRDVSQPVFGVGAGPEIADVFPDYALTGEQRIATAKEKRSAVVGNVLMRKYGWKLGDTITLRGTESHHMEMTFVILGTISSKHYPNTFLMRRDYLMAARKAHGLPDEDIAWNIIVRATSNDAMGPLAKEIDEHFANSDAETRTMTESDVSLIGPLRYRQHPGDRLRAVPRRFADRPADSSQLDSHDGP